MAYQAVEEIQVRCEKENIPFWKAVQLRRLRGKWDYGRGILAADDTHVERG